jgi:alpha-ketoglutarate-dependent taurine dioxygenase
MLQVDPSMPQAPLTQGPGLWHGADLEKQGGWSRSFPPELLEEIDAALRGIERDRLAPPAFGKERFPLPSGAEFLHGVLEELEEGRGFLLLRGFPIERYTETQAEIIFWGLGQHLGIPLSQNADGHLLGHVRNLGLDIKKTDVRAYQTTAELIFHNDQSDVIALMCLQGAKSGGLSRVVSVTAIQNEIQRRRPDLLQELYRPYYIDRRGERGREDEGDEPYYAMPVLSYHRGLVSARYIRGYIQSAQRFPEVPRLSAKQIEALDLFDSIANEPGMAIAFQMEPGDVQLLNNYCVLHARTNFEDWEDVGKRRHLLRLWLATPNSRELPPSFEKRFGSCKPGVARGGIPPRTRAATEPAETFQLDRV